MVPGLTETSTSVETSEDHVELMDCSHIEDKDVLAEKMPSISAPISELIVLDIDVVLVRDMPIFLVYLVSTVVVPLELS